MDKLKDLIMNNILLLITSIVSAAIAAFISHKLTLGSMKHEVIFKERLTAIRALQVALVSLRKYCLSTIADYEGNEFAPRYDEDCKGALTHRQIISSILEDNSIFFPEVKFKELTELDSQLSILCNFELLKATNWNGWSDDEIAQADNSSGYEGTLRIVEECIKRLQKQID